MVIRQFTRDDTQAVIDLWRECRLTRPWNDPYLDIERKLTVQPELFLVGVEPPDDLIVAAVMAGYNGHRGSVNYLAVRPDHRNMGLGAAMLARAEEALRALGCPTITLQVRPENSDVVGFYERLGYEVFEVVDIKKRLDA
jgi:ribosomal protein S18 acetylase RimI-like enzyme